MIKKLSLLRHAQSADKQTGQSDKDRELSSQGRMDVLRICRVIKKLNINFDLVISSTAQRAKSTSLLLVEAMQINPIQILWREEMYEASANQLLNIVSDLDPNINAVLLVGHNPSISYLIDYLTGVKTGDLPPAGLATIQLKIKDWNEIKQNSGEEILRIDPSNTARHDE